LPLLLSVWVILSFKDQSSKTIWNLFKERNHWHLFNVDFLLKTAHC
jgi:hypothetical protein